MMMDVDGFKKINGSFGHVYGDFVLSWLVDSVKNIIRSNDRIIRWGGDEFLIILPGVSLEGARSMGERILDHLREKSAKEKTVVTVSIGITRLSENDVSVDGMIHRADRAMYEAKTRGKNCVEIFPR